MSKRKATPRKSLHANENWSFATEKTSLKRRTRLTKQIPISVFKYGQKDEKYLMKKLSLGKTNSVVPLTWNKCKIYCAEQSLTLEFDTKDNDNAVVVVHLSCCYDCSFLKDLFTCKVLKFDFTVCLESQMIDLSIFLHDVENKFTNKACTVVKNIMVEFYKIDDSDVFENMDLKAHLHMDNLYKSVKTYRESRTKITENKNLQHANLLPKLRPYQHEAVQWMIQRENNTNTKCLHLLYRNVTLLSGIDIYYNKYTGHICVDAPEVEYVNRGGILADEMGLGKTVEILACILNNPRMEFHTLQIQNADDIPQIDVQLKYVKPKDKVEKSAKPVVNTKISANRKSAQMWYETKLAEMKTFQRKNIRSKEEVQCICGDITNSGLVSCKKCKKKQHALCMGYKLIDNFVCSQCWTQEPLVKSRATLIVSPAVICGQWTHEIERHIRQNGLKVLEYKGIHSAGMMYPTDLADYDIVITTYNVLQSEIKFTGSCDKEHISTSLRYAKRYNISNTPLVFVDWWRLCLDEAQFVKCPAAQVSAMAQQLHAHFRWAVTGTPIQKHLADLYGLVDYLQLHPYNEIDTWNYALYFPFIHGCKEPLIEFLGNVMWRTAKADALQQIDIPTQTVQEHWLDFSAVEKFFYKREHESSAKHFLENLSKFQTGNVELKSIDRQTLNHILAPLLSLRQACTHPYAVRGKYLTSKKQVNSMEELLQVLINKNAKDSEESLRAVLASLNGMAGILLLQQRYLEAIEKYRESLSSMTNYDTNFLKIDKLQRIHTLYNLNQVLNDPLCPSFPPTLRDEKLQADCDSYQRQYMEKYVSETILALDELQQVSKTAVRLEKSFCEGVWLPEIIDWLTDKNCESEICSRVESFALENRNKQKYHKIVDGREIVYLITTWIDKLTKQLKLVRSSLKKFEDTLIAQEQQSYFSDEIVEKAMDCHLRPAKNKKKYSCMCCVLDSNLKKYECILFQMNTKLDKNQSNKGSWKPCLEDDAIRAVYNFAKQRGAPEGLLQDGKAHVKLCEARRKEFKVLRKLYTFFDAQVSAQDELNICKIRFRLRNPHEPTKVIQKKIRSLENLSNETENKYEFIHMMNEFELDINMSSLNSEKVASEEKLKKLIGTHSYLETLRKQQYSGQNPDPCPICNVQLQDSWSILQCGHCYCLECIHKLLENYRIANHVQCSVCRKKQLCSDISYIKVKNNTENTIDDVEINGSYSTKIHAVIYSVLKLKQTDPEVKILIFSSWKNVLKAISDAFGTNQIKHEYLTSTINLQTKLQRFKDERLNVTALLLPIRLGANGLNLTEATQVFLVEPLMNPGEELQAIGRVHRIGQTKPTVVHRFLIKNTMEENIHNAMATNAQQWKDNKLTLADLQDLFCEKIHPGNSLHQAMNV